MQIQPTTGATSVEARYQTGRPRRAHQLVAALVVSLCGLAAMSGFTTLAGAQDALPETACAAYTKWERGDLNPQYVDIALLPLKDVELPANLKSVVNGLAGRKFQGQAEDQAIQKLVEYYKAGCTNAGGSTTGGAVAATTNTTATTTTPSATAPTAITPAAATPAPTAQATPGANATPAAKPTPATSLPNTGFNRASSGLALLGGWLLLAGVAVVLFNRQRN